MGHLPALEPTLSAPAMALGALRAWKVREPASWQTSLPLSAHSAGGSRQRGDRLVPGHAGHLELGSRLLCGLSQLLAALWAKPVLFLWSALTAHPFRAVVLFLTLDTLATTYSWAWSE